MSNFAQLEKQQRRIAKLIYALLRPDKMPLWLLRASYQILDLLCGLPRLKMRRVQNISLPTADSKHKIKLRIYQAETQPLATLVYFHGGGCVIGSLDSHDAFCRHLAHHGQHTVVSVEYRRAPEVKYPQPLIDAIQAWNAIHQHGQEWGLDMQKVGVAGDSAGAYLAALIGLESEQQSLEIHSQRKPNYQLLLYPMVNQRSDYQSNQEFNRDLLLTTDLMALFHYHHLQGSTQPESSLVNLPLSQSLAQSPKTCLITVEFDPLRDPGLAYARALEQTGVDLVHQHFEHCMHGFISVTRFSPQARKKSEQVCQQLKSLAKT